MEKKFLDTNAAALEGVAAGAAEKNEVLPNDGESSSSWEDGERKNKVLPEGVFETADVQENKHEALPIGHDGTIVVVPSVWQFMTLAEEALNLSRWQKLYNLACHHMYWSDKENASLSAYVINEGRKEGREIASTEDGEENEDQGKHGALSEHHQDRLVVGGHYPLHIILEETSSSEDGGEPKIEILSQQIILMQWCKLVQMLSERNEKCDRAAASWHGYCLKSGKAHTKTKTLKHFSRRPSTRPRRTSMRTMPLHLVVLYLLVNKLVSLAFQQCHLPVLFRASMRSNNLATRGLLPVLFRLRQRLSERRKTRSSLVPLPRQHRLHQRGPLQVFQSRRLRNI